MRFTLWIVGLLLAALAPRAMACPEFPKQLLALLVPDNLALFGEIHGTREPPQHVLDVICNARRMGMPVKIGLEIPRELEEDLQIGRKPHGCQIRVVV